jgi:hypothetical protein
MSADVERNTASVKAFYDLMFNRCRPREAIERDAGDEYREHNPRLRGKGLRRVNDTMSATTRGMWRSRANRTIRLWRYPTASRPNSSNRTEAWHSVGVQGKGDVARPWGPSPRTSRRRTRRHRDGGTPAPSEWTCAARRLVSSTSAEHPGGVPAPRGSVPQSR